MTGLVFVFDRPIETMSGLMILWQIVPTMVDRSRLLTVIDEYSRECLAIVVERRLQSDDVLSCITEALC